MPAFTGVEICQATGAERIGTCPEIFSDLVTDTRKITRGALFLALKGERFNGEDFAAKAVALGAAGVMVQENCPKEKYADLAATVFLVPDTLLAYQQMAGWHRQKFSLPVIAITGSNGKTTTKDLAAAVLSVRGSVLKTQANFNNEIGLPLTLLNLCPEHQAAVVEIGMRGFGQIEALAKFARPSIGIVTNVGETHMELLGSLENIAKAKSEMVSAIPAGGTVILNADNPYVAAMAEKAADGVRVLTFGMEKTADIEGKILSTEGKGTLFSCTYQGKTVPLHLPMLGRHNVYNALAALAAGFSLGLSAQEMQDGLNGFQATQMRFECQKLGAYTVINDAYNASPMSMTAAIDTLAEIAAGRTIAVMGDMLELGSVSVAAHRKVGQELAEHGVAVLLTRGEMGEYIAKGAEEAGLPAVYRCASHAEAGKILNRILEAGDTILFKGSRGMQMEKIIDLIEA